MWPFDRASAYDGVLGRKVGDPSQLAAVSLSLVRRAPRGSAGSKALGKQVFYRQIGLTQEHAYQLAGHEMAEGALSPDAQEGFAAFLGKREASYRMR